MTRLSPAMLVAVLWLTVGCANLALLSLGPSDVGTMLKVTGTTVCGLLLSLLLATATTRFPAGSGRRSGAVLMGLSLLGGGLLWAIDASLQVQQIGSPPHWPSPSAFAPVRLNLVYYSLLFVLQSSALALLASQRTIQARERQLGEARFAAQQARLAALRSQVNPHFLFNTLNALSTLVAEERAAEAEEMIGRLSSFLRASLEFDGVDLVPLEVELETVHAYLRIEAVRFGERLRISYSVDEGLSEALVPILVLQPLVENAIKHAVAPTKGPVTVTVAASGAGDTLLLTVADRAALPAGRRTPVQHGAGVGLRNVGARLDTLYGAAGTLQAAATSGGYTATVSLPLRFSDRAPR